jgi:hypothetical protein
MQQEQHMSTDYGSVALLLNECRSAPVSTWQVEMG